jgi:hypothetical protein
VLDALGQTVPTGAIAVTMTEQLAAIAVQPDSSASPAGAEMVSIAWASAGGGQCGRRIR